MARNMVRFSIELPRETDVAVGKLADVEGRPSKSNMHIVLLNRIARLWESDPAKAIAIGLVKPERATEGAT
jgi:hypothetical protein